MKLIAAALACLLSYGAWPLQSALTPENWDTADRATVRLKPSVFPDLAAPIRADLERRGCTIPQDAYERGRPPHNIIRGRFTSAIQMDVAVLCSINRVSVILVYRGGSTKGVAELAKHPDRDFLQGMGPDQPIAFSRGLNTVSPKYIEDHAAAYNKPKPPPLDHDGIDDGFDGKASVVWYWYGGKWLALQGAN
jgi:hypothetical protein